MARFLEAPDPFEGCPIDSGMKQRLLRHLDSYSTELDLDICSRPDSGLGSSPSSINDSRESNGRGGIVGGPQSPVHANYPPGSLVKSDMHDYEASARPDSSTNTGDENNNRSRPTSAFTPVVSPADSQHQSAFASTSANQRNSEEKSPMSVVQVVPSRLPNGQVVFLLPNDYCQLAAANAINVGPSPPQPIWAATNMSLLAENERKRSLEDATSTTQLPPRPPSEQPLDFTTPKKIKLESGRWMEDDQQKPTTTKSAGQLQPIKDEEGMWRPW